jgi:hypothetical protein
LLENLSRTGFCGFCLFYGFPCALYFLFGPLEFAFGQLREVLFGFQDDPRRIDNLPSAAKRCIFRLRFFHWERFPLEVRSFR